MSDVNPIILQDIDELVRLGQEGVVTSDDVRKYLQDRDELSNDNFEKVITLIENKNISVSDDDHKTSSDDATIGEADETVSVDSVRSICVIWVSVTH